MPLEQPLLTIAIPTYNRSTYLSQLLTVLALQVKNEPQVELIISDNASPDDTPALIETFRRDGLECRYIRNETNIGSDANFLQCFEEARGKYVWLFGDDDVLVPGGLRKIVACLESGEYDMVYLHSFPFSGDALPSEWESTPSRAPETILDAESFARRIHFMFAFITANILNKNKLSQTSHQPFSTLVGTNLIHLGWAYTALSTYRRGLYIHETLVGNRGANTGGYALCTVFGHNLQSITGAWLPPRLQAIVLNKILHTFFPYFLLQMRSTAWNLNFHHENPHAELSKVFGGNPRYWLFAYPMIVLPKSAAYLWLQGVRAVNRLDRISGGTLVR